jgi:hypothetical protein
MAGTKWGLEFKDPKFEFPKFKISKLYCLKHLKFGHLILSRVSDFVLRVYTRLSMNNAATAELPFFAQFSSYLFISGAN